MATVIQRPDALSLSGNLKDVILSSAVKSRFVLKKGATILLDEEYLPDSSNRINIDIKDVVNSALSFTIPSSDVYSQAGIAADFSIEIDGTSAGSFRAVRCGIENFSDTAANFLTANWLTWQLQTKQVTALQPEWLTYYFVVAGTAKAKFYNTDGTFNVITLGTGAIGDCKSFNVQWSHLWSLGETLVAEVAKPRYGYIDVWVENNSGVALSYTQRYIYRPAAALGQVYLCQNSLGGIDTFLFSGERIFVPENEHKIASYNENLEAIDIETKRKWSQNTGPLAGITNIWELFRTLKAYYLSSGTIMDIVLDESSLENSNIENINSATFIYRLSGDKGFLQVQRSASLPTNLEVVSPDSSLFFLAPRLVDFPEAIPNTSLLLPVQTPYAQSWKKLSLSSLRNWIVSFISEITDNIVGHIPALLRIEDDENNVDLDSVGASILKIRSEHLRKDVADTAAEPITFSKGLITHSHSLTNEIDTGLLEGDDTPLVDDSEVETTTRDPDIYLSDVADVADISQAPDNSILVKQSGLWNFMDINERFGLRFKRVSITDDFILINHSLAPNAIVELVGNYPVFRLHISNSINGDTGKILLLQTGLKQIMLDGGIVGTVDLPLNENTICLLEYNNINGTIYIHTNDILPDTAFPAPRKIIDFQAVYYDSSLCSVTWTAPYANNIYDRATGYDMRYANGPVDANNQAVWNSLSQIDIIKTPATPGLIETFTIQGLSQNTEYYIYIKSYKINFGVKYLSEAGDYVYFRTKGYGTADMSYYKLNIDARNFYPRRKNCALLDGVRLAHEYAFDEAGNEQYNEVGALDLVNSIYNTYYKPSLSRVDTPWYIDIDLNALCTLDKMYVRVTGALPARIFISRGLGYDYEYLCDIGGVFNSWEIIDFGARQVRFVRFAFDKNDFSYNSPDAMGEEWYPSTTGIWQPVTGIYKILIYGREHRSQSVNILPPMRKSISPRTMDEFFCTNGHFYQPGRIHHLCSGSHVRLFGSGGWFCPPPELKNNINRIADFSTNPSNFQWVNWGHGLYNSLKAILDSYARYGLKPFLAWSGISIQWFGYDASSADKRDNKPLDQYWLPDAWRPLPTKGGRGYEQYFKQTMDPANYKSYAKMCHALAAIYGQNSEIDINTLTLTAGHGILSCGLNLLSGIEISNEPDATWDSWMHYYHPEEYGAELSAVADGHCGTLVDEDNKSIGGMKGADSHFLVISPGFAGFHKGYYHMLMQWAKRNRQNGSVPGDVINYHTYFSNLGASNQDGDNTSANFSVSGDIDEFLSSQKAINEYRCRFFPDKELWITEFGHGESGADNTASGNQCYSQPGRLIGDWLIPDRHRSEVKGAYIIRDVVAFLIAGIDMVNYFLTEGPVSYFGTGQYDGGAGYEMWDWKRCTDTTPGAKVAAVKQYMVGHQRGGFATCGLFGELLGNGAYPITNAFWYVATFRNRFTDYYFTGIRHCDSDDRIMIACFRKRNENKGAYVVYLRSNENDGVDNVSITLPSNSTYCKKIITYLPEITDPRTVPNNIGNDILRSGLPTSRREKYIYGQWVIQNVKPDYINYESFAVGAANYPANPQEGDEVIVLPTAEENPYFPIVGPVANRYSSHAISLSAQQYEELEEGIWVSKYDSYLALRQIDAVCDFIEYSTEGQHGTSGDETNMEITASSIVDNVTEFPAYYFFDGIAEVDFNSAISDLTVVAINSTSVKLLWNNNSEKDTGYEIFRSSLPETQFAIISTIAAGVENSAIIDGLSGNTTYYFRIRPICEDKKGTMSNVVGVTTPQFLPAPQNLALLSRTATYIKIGWDYQSEQIANFISYGVYRATSNGDFTLVGQVEDFAVHEFTDSGLVHSTNYIYKVRAIGLSGVSEYSQELNDRTALISECSPTLTFATTNKLGNKIILTFDIPIGSIEASAISDFLLTEDNNVRPIFLAGISATDTHKIILSIAEDSISDYTTMSALRISYMSNGHVKSEYNVNLDTFTCHVINMTGNFTNLEATYKINLCNSTDALPESEEWNNLVGAPNTAEAITLHDTYGRQSVKTAAPFYNKNNYVWGANIANGYCEIEGIEEHVYKNGWGTAYGGTMTENKVGRIVLSNLNDTKHYTVKAYGGTKYGSAKAAKIKVNGVYSSTVEQLGNVLSFMSVEDCTSSGGVLNVDLITTTEDARTTSYPHISFIIIEEYGSDSDPDNTDVYIRELVVPEIVDGATTQSSINVRFNCIGTALEYRYGLNADLSDGVWTALEGTLIVTIPLAAFEDKTFFFQVRNASSESNIKSLSFTYSDPYVVLNLKSVVVNDDDNITYNRDVSVTPVVDGIPTHYKIGETADLSGVEWSEFVSGTIYIPYILSAGAGIKTVYIMMKDSLTESPVKSDTITYQVLEHLTASVDVELPAGVSPEDIIVKIAPLKYNKRFCYGYTTDDNSMQSFSVLWNLINKKWIDDSDFLHLGEEKTANGFTPAKTLGYTDGCGNERRFAINNALIPIKTDNPYSHYLLEGSNGAQQPYLTLAELLLMLDFDCDFAHHNVDENVYDKTDPVSILTGFDEVDSYMASKTGAPAIAFYEPDGNSNYTTAALNHDNIKVLLRNRGANGYDFRDVLATGFIPEKIKIGRFFPEDTLASFKSTIDALAAGSILGESALWGETGAHRPRATITDGAHGLATEGGWKCRYELLNYINDTYGKDGSDEVWFATSNEIIEYLIFKEYAIITKTINDGMLHIEVDWPKFNNFKWFEITLLLSAGSSIAASSESTIGLSSGMNNSRYMININAMNTLLTRAEKYTALFESLVTTEARDDAEYFIHRLKPSLQTSFLARIAAVTSAPVLSSVTLDGGEDSTNNPLCSLSISYTGNASEIMISESADFTGAAWLSLPQNSFILSGEAGVKIVYVKIKNSYGASNVLSYSITYNPLTFNLSAISINGGDESTSSSQLSVSFTPAGVGTPAYYRLAESQTALASATWIAYANPCSFTHGLTASGPITLHAQIKDTSDNVSEIVSDTISYIASAKPYAIIKEIGYQGSASYGLITGDRFKYSICMADHNTLGKYFWDDGTEAGLVYNIDAGDLVAVGLSDALLNQALGSFAVSDGWYPEIFFQKFRVSQNVTSVPVTARAGGYKIRIAPGTYTVKIWEAHSVSTEIDTRRKIMVNGIDYQAAAGVRLCSQLDIKGTVSIKPEMLTVQVTVAAETGQSYGYITVIVHNAEETPTASLPTSAIGAIEIEKEN